MVDWLSISRNSGSAGTTSVTITASTLTDFVDRVAYLTISGQTTSATLSVLQEAEGNIVLSTNSVSFGAVGGSSAITYTANDVPSLSLSNNYFTATLGANNTINITAPISSAFSTTTATLTVTVRGVSKTVSISQDAVLFTMSGSNTHSISSAQTSSAFTITGNVNWKASVNPSASDWLSISDTGVCPANSACSIHYTAQRNTGGTRNGGIYANWGESYQYSRFFATVSQSGKTYAYVYYTTTDGTTITPSTAGWSSSTYTSSGAYWYKEVTAGTISGLKVSSSKLRTVESEDARLNPMFTGCTSLEKVNLPNSTPTSSGAFSGCTSLWYVRLNVYTIMVSTFNGCTSLEQFISTYTGGSPTYGVYIEAAAFNNCTSLRYLEFHCPKTASIASGAHPFNGVPSGGSLYRPAGYDYSAISNELINWNVFDN